MKKYIVACDICKVETGMKYNGEHYLCPENWYEFYHDKSSRHTGIHICDKCYFSLWKIPTEPESNEK